MQTVPGSRQPTGGGVWKKDDGGGTNVSGKTEREGRVRGLREGDDGRVAGIPPDDAAQEGKGGKVELERLSHGRGAKNISDRLPDQWRSEGVSCGGLPRKGWDKDGDEDTFLQPACLEHCDHLGVGEPPTPKVLIMRHAGPVADPKWETSRYRDVQEWGGAKETVNGGDQTARNHRDELRSLR